MVNWQSDYDHFMADNVLKRGELGLEIDQNKLLSTPQKQEMITLVKILLRMANLHVSEWTVSNALDWIKVQDYKKLNGEDERRKKIKEFKKFMRVRLSLEDRKFKERVILQKPDALSVFEASAAKALGSNYQDKYTPAEKADLEILTGLLGARGFVLEKPQGTSVHHFLDHLHEVEKIKGAPTDAESLNAYTFIKSDFQSFVVEHNWAAAFENVQDFDGGDVRLPFQFTCFEFRISGIRVLIFLGETKDGIRGIMTSGINKRWYICPHLVTFDHGVLSHPALAQSDLDPSYWDYLKKLGAQIRAVCIMLDAKVAVGERKAVAGPGLNKQRAREGKAPVKDYHVVTLSKRMRYERNPDAVSTGARKALHWRRGHWRHFKSAGGEIRYSNEEGYTVSKTWINWQLVGDETLGFVDKHYKL